MPRLPRAVFPNIPHHITQRGNRREDVFFSDEDRLFYLELLQQYCKKYKVTVLAYCLMDNHVHLVLTPVTADGLQKVLKPVHMRYAQYINELKGWKGHLWQGRFFSSALDDGYTCSTVRYVERNPVQANMIDVAEDYRWSSAAYHCGLTSSKVLTPLPQVFKPVSSEAWSDWLALPESKGTIDLINRHIEKGLPCGSDDFIAQLERLAKRPLRFRSQGRPNKE
ncbi:MAG: transposase [Piscirickettsiaceae bacterium]|nr:MAG: transposase [Piscirickettsiaceae bacterium]